MTALDYTIVVLAALAALVAAGSFAAIMRYLFDRGLADRNKRSADIRQYYQTYLSTTKRETGRIGTALWIHGISTGVFICAGVGYTIFRFILPRLI